MCVFDFLWPNCHVILNISIKQIINVQSKFAGALCESPQKTPFLFFAPVVRVHPSALSVRVHPAAPTVRMHEVTRPVRVCLQGGWVRNGIRVNCM